MERKRLPCGGCRRGSPALEALLGLAGVALLSRRSRAQAKKPKAKVALAFCHPPSQVPTWPRKGFDYAKRNAEITRQLQRLCPEVEFGPILAVHNKKEAEALVNRLKAEKVDGLVVYITGIWTGAPGVLVRAGLPTVLADDLFGGSGEFLMVGAAAKREKLPVVPVASSRIEDVARAARLLWVKKALSQSRILRIHGRWPSGHKESVPIVGTEVLDIHPDDFLNHYYRGASEAKAERWADKWIGEAVKVVEPTREEIVKAAKIYLAMMKALYDSESDGIAINCLGLYYGGKLPAYPCLGYMQMNSDGTKIGICEADIMSGVTMLFLKYLTGRASFISDPVIDTAKGWIVYAHCIAPIRMFGPKGPQNPYIIRSHAEDNRGASVQSLLPLGHKVTTLELNPWAKAIVMHQGTAVANLDLPEACRTKLAVKANVRRILDRGWTWGWHRVTVYGDWRRDILNFASLLGFEVIEEDK